MPTLLRIVIASLLVSLMSFTGIIFFGLGLNIRRITFYLISLASGTMLGGAVLHIIPEALEANGPRIFQSVALGIFLFFILEKLLIWRHCHIHQRPDDHSRPVAANMVLIGDAIHNAIDGAIIASAFMTNPTLGISITIAIVLHEIPQELGDFGILIHGGYTMKQALFLNVLTAMSSLVGAIVTYFFIGASSLVAIHVLPVAAGGLLYIALADLIPQLHDRFKPGETALQILLLGIGFGAMVLLKHPTH